MWWRASGGVAAVALAAMLVTSIARAEGDLPAQIVLASDEPAEAPGAPPAADASEGEKSGAGTGGAMSKLTLPIPVGHEVKGIRIPHYDVYGAKQLDFFAKQARRTEQDVIRMTDAEIEFFNEAGGSDMKVYLPSAVLNLGTQMLGSDQPARIVRSDFIITGDKLVFNIQEKRGRLIGHVRMLVFDKETIGAKSPQQP